MRKLILITTLAAISTGAIAEWVVATKSSSGETFFINPDSIKVIGGVRRAWILYNNESPKKMAMSTRTLMEFKCEDERYRPLALTSFSEKFAAGNIVFDAKPDELNEQTGWQYIGPGDVMEKISNIVCKRKL